VKDLSKESKPIEATILPPKVKTSPSEAKLRARDIVRFLDTSRVIWEGAKVQFGLSDDTFMTEPQFKAYINAFLRIPAQR
jgi:hypothetical protein